MGLPSGRDNTENPPVPRFKSYFEKFVNVVGTERFLLGDFSKSALHKNDVRMDFLKIGLPDRHQNEISLSQDPTNESLSAEAIAIAVEITKSTSGSAQDNLFFRRYNSFLGSIKGAPIQLSEDEKRLIMAASRPHLEYLQQTFAMELREPDESLSGDVELFGKKTIESLALQLRRVIDHDAETAARWAATSSCEPIGGSWTRDGIGQRDFQRAPQFRECQMSGTGMTLTDLADRFKSDKGAKVGAPPHRYTYLYDLLFWQIKELPLNLLEIGLAAGGPEVGGPVERTASSPSIQMWLSYFPNAHIYGFDISDFPHIKDRRFTFIRGDAGSETDLGRLANSALKFDVVIDDASHASYHQQLTFKVLFPKLAPGGIYIIEDLQWQSPAFEEVLPKVPKTAAFFCSFFEKGEYINNKLLSAEAMIQVKTSLASFASFGAFDGSPSATKLIVMRKASEQEDGRAIHSPVKTPASRAVPPGGEPNIPVEDIINATYKAVLGRPADQRGLQAYRKAFNEMPFPASLERILDALLRSKEFQGRQVVKALEKMKPVKETFNDNKNAVLFVQTADSRYYRALLWILRLKTSKHIVECTILTTSPTRELSVDITHGTRPLTAYPFCTAWLQADSQDGLLLGCRRLRR